MDVIVFAFVTLNLHQEGCAPFPGPQQACAGGVEQVIWHDCAGISKSCVSLCLPDLGTEAEVVGLRHQLAG